MTTLDSTTIGNFCATCNCRPCVCQPTAQHTCPRCGYCPHCGRGGHIATLPYWPYWSVIPPYPNVTTTWHANTSGDYH
jgi:hypothetical protein